MNTLDSICKRKSGRRLELMEYVAEAHVFISDKRLPFVGAPKKKETTEFQTNNEVEVVKKTTCLEFVW